jgi:predicted MFS family arabinose efflux permease
VAFSVGEGRLRRRLIFIAADRLYSRVAMRQPSTIGADGHIAVWRAALSGLCATLVGIGLARFAYTPLIPALIAAHWFTPSQTAYLGAANLAGYLAGALAARPIVARASRRGVLSAMMLLATGAFFACAVPLSVAWFSVWRFAAGLAGGVLMVLAAPTVLAQVPSARRGIVGGAIFTGVGLGIAASGTLVPVLMTMGLTQTWCGLGVLALVLTVAASGGWPRDDVDRKGAPTQPLHQTHDPRRKALYVEYALTAAGQVPHMVFLVDFVARGLGRGLGQGAFSWVLFGLGAMVGPALTGHLADRIGFGPALRVAFATQAFFVGALALTTRSGWLIASSIVIGAAVPGIVPLTLGRVHELVDDNEARAAGWRSATIAFAVGQAGAAYFYSYLFAQTGSYVPLYAIAAGLLMLALAIDLVATWWADRVHQANSSAE